MTMSGRASTTRSKRSRLARAGFLALALAAVAALGLVASGCGGSSSGGVAQVESSETTTTPASQASSGSADPAAYSACMRRNGVPKFPDPDAQGRLQIPAGEGLDPNSPRVKAAEKTCQRFMPRGGGERPDPEEQAKQLQEAIKYSACMRKHGVPNYPDPKANAEGGLELSLDGTGVDFDAPQLKAAEEACKALAPGANGGDTKRSSAP
jgi:hypothetical protein